MPHRTMVYCYIAVYAAVVKMGEIFKVLLTIHRTYIFDDEFEERI